MFESFLGPSASPLHDPPFMGQYQALETKKFIRRLNRFSQISTVWEFMNPENLCNRAIAGG